MPPAKQPNLHVLHLYRHLLRECSYLPPAFSKQISGMIWRDFHRFRTSENYHLKNRIKRAESALRTIRGATNGDATAMEKLVMKGFGRTGRRRKKLEQEFLVPEGVKNSEQLETQLSGDSAMSTVGETAKEDQEDTRPNQGRRHYTPPKSPKKHNHGFMEKWDKKKLLALLKSQKQAADASSSLWAGGDKMIKIKTLNEDAAIPKTNIWGKPLHETVIRTKRAKFWKLQAAKMYPPLPKGEWELLEKLSLQPQSKGEWKMPERRVPAQPVIAEDERSWDWETYATKPVNHVEKPPRQRQQRRKASGKELPGPYQGKSGTRTISDRRFRHMYMRAWAYSSYMEQNPKTLATRFQWGATPDKIPTGAAEPNKLQMEIFENVDKNGVSIKP